MHWTAFRKIQEDLIYVTVLQLSENQWEKTLSDSV